MKELNVIGTMQLLAACQRAASQRVVLKSTTAVYGASRATRRCSPRPCRPGGCPRRLREGQRGHRGLRALLRPPASRHRRHACCASPTSSGRGSTRCSPASSGCPSSPRRWATTRACSCCTRTTPSTCLRLAATGRFNGTVNVGGEGTCCCRRRSAGPAGSSCRCPAPRSPRRPAPRRFGFVDYSPEQMRFLNFGRVVDTTVLRTDSASPRAYRRPTALDVLPAGAPRRRRWSAPRPVLVRVAADLRRARIARLIPVPDAASGRSDGMDAARVPRLDRSRGDRHAGPAASGRAVRDAGGAAVDHRRRRRADDDVPAAPGLRPAASGRPRRPAAWTSSAAGLTGVRVDEFGFDPDLAEHALLPLLGRCTGAGSASRCTASRTSPAEGGALLVANHSGTLPVGRADDRGRAARRAPRAPALRLLGADLVFRTPVIGSLARKWAARWPATRTPNGCSPRGELVGVFPRGSRASASRSASATPCSASAGAVSSRRLCATGVPIIPCDRRRRGDLPDVGNAKTVARLLNLPYFPITPTFPLLGPLGLVPLPSKWLIAFGEPIDTAAYGPGAAEDPMLVFNLDRPGAGDHPAALPAAAAAPQRLALTGRARRVPRGADVRRGGRGPRPAPRRSRAAVPAGAAQRDGAADRRRPARPPRARSARRSGPPCGRCGSRAPASRGAGPAAQLRVGVHRHRPADQRRASAGRWPSRCTRCTGTGRAPPARRARGRPRPWPRRAAARRPDGRCRPSRLGDRAERAGQPQPGAMIRPVRPASRSPARPAAPASRCCWASARVPDQIRSAICSS